VGAGAAHLTGTWTDVTHLRRPTSVSDHRKLVIKNPNITDSKIHAWHTQNTKADPTSRRCRLTMAIGMAATRPTRRCPLTVLLVLLLDCFLSKSCNAWSFNSHSHSRKSTERKSNEALSHSSPLVARRSFVASVSSSLAIVASGILPTPSGAEDTAGVATSLPEVQVILTGDSKRFFNEARALESQGNLAAAQRLYSKVTKIVPRFIYGWSSLGNTQTAFGDLDSAEASYSTAIDLCNENLDTTEAGLGIPRCTDLYVLLLNRGSLRLNHNMPKEALADLQKADLLRAQPDAIVLQNLARAKEVNGLYSQADRDYNVAISMSSNEVNPFWLRSAMVKFQLGEIQGGFDLLKRVENRFPDAPEVRAAYAVFLAARGDQIAGQRKYLEIPDKQRLKYVDKEFLTKNIVWPPKMIEALKGVSSAVGDGVASSI
jgi:tetratricopeptide (TPR) repeat protein